MAVPKLFQWLAGIAVFMSVWSAIVFQLVPVPLSPSWHDVVTVLPLYLLISFACYSLAVVGYRVATFNDCVAASEQLKEQVEEAKEDLKRRGYKYANEFS
ncbi:dolichol-phosphate mannosyltransferase subunit 3-like [Babylonia areolata]|uniref:dolichol-phosphate mannosyltransferase subunit 3-like n=1 Tax=Babylonia areolata TaxID=304850 RepID=UPI003FD261CD